MKEDKKTAYNRAEGWTEDREKQRLAAGRRCLFQDAPSPANSWVQNTNEPEW